MVWTKSRVLRDFRVRRILLHESDVCSKAEIADLICDEAGFSVGKMTVYKYQRELGLI